MPPIVSFGGGRDAPSPPSGRREGANVFDAVVAHVGTLARRRQARARRLLEQGARERLATLLAEHGIGDDAMRVETWPRRSPPPPSATTFAVLPLETGFEAPDLAVIGEQDILGDRLVRRDAGPSAAATCSPKRRA